MARAHHLLLLIFLLSATGQSFGLQGNGSEATGSERLVLKRARQLQAEHQLQAASDLLGKYVATHTADASVLTLLADIRHDAKDDQSALKFLGQALSLDPKARETNLAAGKLLLSQDRFPEAMDRFEVVLETLPRDQSARTLELEAVTRLATSAARAGKPEAALEALRHARTKIPDSSRLLMELGLQALDLRLFTESTEALEAAHALAPSDPDIVYAIARLELQEQQMPQAEAHLKTYLAARPSDASAHYGLARVFGMQQRTEEARREFERSIELQPLQTESYYELGELDLKAQNIKSAEPLFRRVIARDPKHGGALVGLGQIAFQAKDYDLAQSYLLRAVDAAPDYGLGHYYLGLTLARLGKKQQAERELQIATQLGKAAAAPVQSAQPEASPQ